VKFIGKMPMPQSWLKNPTGRIGGWSYSRLKNGQTRVTCRLISGREITMSQHRSLKGASTIAAKRNVLKRFERVELLKKRGQWKEGGKVMGLPKTKPDV
jgi:small basic protein (TIGR04137 family)